MLLKEYRICLPLTVAEYRIAQLYMIQKKSREESTGRGSGVEILKNEPYQNGPGGSGQYTFKVYHVGSHLPAWMRNILPSSALRVEEEAWNAYPYTRTIYKVPFVEKFTLDIETYYYDDGGEQDDVFHLSADEKKARIVDYIDIVKDPLSSSDYKPEEDPLIYVSHATGRGPLTQNWREDYIQAQTITHEHHTRPPTRTHDNKPAAGKLTPLPKRIMCAYKLCRVEFRYWGTQTRVEQFIHDTALRRTMVRAHRQVWAWQDEWYGLTIEEIRRLEEETARALANKMADASSSDEGAKSSTPTNQGPVNSSSSLIAQTNTPADIQNRLSTINSYASAPQTGQDDPEAGTIWDGLKKLENNETEQDDEYEPFIDDDTASYVSCRSFCTDNTFYLSASPSNIDGFNSVESNSNPSRSILILVVHGGCLLDSVNDLATKRSDISTLRRTFELVISHHYPVLIDRIAIRLVPCPSGLNEIFQQLARLKTSPLDPTTSLEVQLAQDLIPLGSIPLFLTNSSKYPQLLNELAHRLNTHYAEFIRSPEGTGFQGSVFIVADSVGAILTHDVLSITSWAELNGFDQTASDSKNITVMDAGARRWRQSIVGSTFQSLEPGIHTSPTEDTLCPNKETSNVLETNSEESTPKEEGNTDLDPNNKKLNFSSVLDFHVQNFFMLGSPVGMLLTYRYQNQLGTIRSRSEDTNHHKSPDATAPNSPDSTPTKMFDLSQELRIAADQVYNLFHPFDPSGFRIEPILDTRFSHISPIYIPEYVRYPLGDGYSANLVETLMQQTHLFDNSSKKKLSKTDGNKMSSVQRQETSRKIWEHQSLVAIEALKKVRQYWWGQKRVDYSVNCPEGVQSLLVRARPTILHASYWESKDVAAFILRQILDSLGLNLPDSSYSVDMADEVAVAAMVNLSMNPCSDSQSVGSGESGNFLPFIRENSNQLGRQCSNNSGSSIGARMFLKRNLSEKTKNFKPNHRGNDVITLSGEPQIICARFSLGGLDLMSYDNEKINVQVQSLGGKWTYLGTEVTDSSGRICFRVPDQSRLPIGIHPIRLTPDSDPDHSIQLALAIVPPQTEVVLFSVDGSFAASLSLMGKDPKVQPGAVDVARHWQGLGYLLIYISARPDMQRRRVTNWMATHNFPYGMTFFVDGLYKDPLKQKAQMMKSIITNAQLKVHCAYGSGKDINLYRSFGLSSRNIFVVGKVSKSLANYATILTSGYRAHLSSLINGLGVSRQAIGAISALVRCTPFDLPLIRPFPSGALNHNLSNSDFRYGSPSPSR